MEKTENTYTGKQIDDAVGHFFLTNRRLPAPGELAAKMGIKHQLLIGPINDFRKSLVTLTVMPDGKIVTADGKPVWRQNTAGSMTLACYRTDKELGAIVWG